MLTKSDLQQIDNLIRLHVSPLQKSQDSFERKLIEFKSEILDAVDEVMGELKRSREEQEMQSYKLSNHEDRIGNLETKVSPSV